MSKTGKIIAAIFLVIAVFSVLSCGAPAASPQESDQLNKKLSDAQSKITSLEAQLVELGKAQARYDELSKQYDIVRNDFETAQAQYNDLSKNYDAIKSDYEKLQAQNSDLNQSYEKVQSDYTKLKTQYDALSKDYANVTASTGEVNERDVEQKLFALVNEARVADGLEVSLWGENLYGWALTNSRNMAKSGQLEYSDYSSWNEALWTTGYATADRMAQAIFTLWQNGSQYERNFLNPSATYCAVGVVRSGEIFYLTYIASPFR